MDEKKQSSKIPIFNLRDPDYCEHGCPVCTRARRGVGWAKVLQKLELIFTFGGCPWGRARRKKYGVGPSEPLPVEQENEQDPDSKPPQ